MRPREPLDLLRQVKEGKLQELRHQLAQAEAARHLASSLYAEQHCAEQALTTKYGIARCVSVSTKESELVSALQKQVHYRYVAELTESLRLVKLETVARRKTLEQAESTVIELRNEMNRLLGQTAGIAGIVQREERREALRQERANDDALTEQWVSRAR
jgi:hypothetical protein